MEHPDEVFRELIASQASDYGACVRASLAEIRKRLKELCLLIRRKAAA
jgi:hypothetical protein